MDSCQVIVIDCSLHITIILKRTDAYALRPARYSISPDPDVWMWMTERAKNFNKTFKNPRDLRLSSVSGSSNSHIFINFKVHISNDKSGELLKGKAYINWIFQFAFLHFYNIQILLLNEHAFLLILLLLILCLSVLSII